MEGLHIRPVIGIPIRYADASLPDEYFIVLWTASLKAFEDMLIVVDASRNPFHHINSFISQ